MLIFYTAKEDGTLIALKTLSNNTQEIVSFLHENVASKVTVLFENGAQYSDWHDLEMIDDDLKEVYKTINKYYPKTGVF